MNIHEYQAKQLFREHGIPVPPGEVAATVKQAAEVARESGAQRWVVKAQIHAGGRGDGHFLGRERGAGGIRFVDSIAQLERDAGEMLGPVPVWMNLLPSDFIHRWRFSPTSFSNAFP